MTPSLNLHVGKSLLSILLYFLTVPLHALSTLHALYTHVDAAIPLTGTVV